MAPAVRVDRVPTWASANSIAHRLRERQATCVICGAGDTECHGHARELILSPDSASMTACQMTPVNCIDLHAHFSLPTRLPPMPFENPSDIGQAPCFATLSMLFNNESGQPRVSFERWFADDQDGAVTGFGSVLYDPGNAFFVRSGSMPSPQACRQVSDYLDAGPIQSFLLFADRGRADRTITSSSSASITAT
jgi:hypothetical protein